MCRTRSRWWLCLISASSLAVATGAGAADPTASPATSAPAAQPAPAPDSTPAVPDAPAAAELRLSLHKAVMMALENNCALQVERLTPDISTTFVGQERAVFDPTLTGNLSFSRARSESAGGPTISKELTQSLQGGIGLSEYLPTGTTIALGADVRDDRISGAPDLAATRPGITVTQALLRGFGLGPNLVRLRQAEVDALSSEYELRGFIQALVENTEGAYWDYTLARLSLEIVNKSLGLAERQLDEAHKRVDAGVLAPVELPAAEAEVALRREALINAQGVLELARLQLIRTINPPGPGSWDLAVVPDDPPDVGDEDFGPAEEHVALALRMRPEMNQARLQIQRGDLELVRTRNGLLPKLDFFMTLGSTGYASSFHDTPEKLGGDTYDLTAGLTLSLPIGNRDAKAQHRRARLQRQQEELALRNLAQTVQVDVRSALTEITRTQGQRKATAATRRFQEEAVRAETEKFQNGKSTSLLVSQAQRDLLVSQVAEVAAQVSYRKARVHLYRVDGSLLERRGLDAPGRQPIEPGPGEPGS